MTAQPGQPDEVLFDLPGQERKEPARGKADTARSRRPAKRRPADRLPVARVIVDTPLPHLDRYFDYRVPADMDEAAVPGCRVKVRFNGRLLAGFLAERVESSEFAGQLAYLETVVSPEPVLTPEILSLSRAVADRYAGTLSDVLRLAVPPRHARVEKEAALEERAREEDVEGVEPADEDPPETPETALPPEDGAPVQETVEAAVLEVDPGPWDAYPEGPAFIRALHAGRPARAVWNALPGGDWTDAIAVAAEAALGAGRGTVVVLPDGRDVAAVDAALTRHLGEGRHAALTADLGPAKRYRSWLSVLRGQVRVVVGTRAAVFAPVRDLGLVVLWDDGDDVHVDPHAPYLHARTVLAMRAHRAGAAALIGGHTRTTDAQLLVESGWARPLVADRATLRSRAPLVKPAGDDRELARDGAARSARMPSVALRSAREAAKSGPVLFQVPRRGYLNTLACAGCREPARCDACNGPLAVRGSHAMPSCGWCGRVAGQWACPGCGASRMRAVVVGARRTAEELGRAFPSLTVRTSGREEVLSEVPDKPSLVVATPGAEPAVTGGGYAAAVLLDGWALLNRADLRASEETLRRWLNASALVRPGGAVVVSADVSLPVVQSLVRWDPGGFAERELAERRELGFPPAVSMASVTGAPEHVRELLDQIELPERAELLGPVPVGPERTDSSTDQTERALLRVPRGSVGELTRALKTAASARSARRDEHLAQVRVDPLHVL
ncbi:putative primosomal protein N' [Nocardiopsis terrae]|uniref:Probable replication restart protein PriA n=1 Tax=Nocardiopsis terrae TaxID=372655 RepID=A0ABR9HJL8_9ACTN|nr:primosomal protein N' [Nocardiopsis terrae]MBE1459212.1 primosomal protein N' (replication factor Y) [Nocardiopsis terrae]GHC88778.1 putative primosomal protein N' [Nocardiopsis terrae]